MGRPKGSKNKKTPGLKLKGVQGKFYRSYPGEDPHVDFLPPEVPDFEKVAPEPVDEASQHKYPPPKKHPTFRRVWMQFIDNVSGRENFKVGHLNPLEVLCDLYVEYEELQDFIRVKGRTYVSVGRNGEVWKTFPEVQLLKNVQSQITAYMKMLDLVLKKDHSVESGGEKSAWE